MIPDLGVGRATAEATLTDRCAITRVDRSTPRTVDPDTLALVTEPDVAVWSGPCSASPAGAGHGQSTSGATQGRIDAYVVRVPASTPLIQAGDAVTFTAVGLQGVQVLLGRTFVVQVADGRSTAVLRRLTCVEVGPGDGVPA